MLTVILGNVAKLSKQNAKEIIVSNIHECGHRLLRPWFHFSSIGMHSEQEGLNGIIRRETTPFVGRLF